MQLYSKHEPNKWSIKIELRYSWHCHCSRYALNFLLRKQTNFFPWSLCTKSQVHTKFAESWIKLFIWSLCTNSSRYTVLDKTPLRQKNFVCIRNTRGVDKSFPKFIYLRMSSRRRWPGKQSPTVSMSCGTRCKPGLDCPAAPHTGQWRRGWSAAN